MLDFKTLQEVDKSKIFETYDKWAEISRESYNSDLDSIKLKDIDHIVFAGMGGSGALGDVFSSILSKTNIHVSLVKGYLLPKTVDKNSLVIFTSVSGNTTETLYALKSAKQQECNTISFSSGGLLETFCKNFFLKSKKSAVIPSSEVIALKRQMCS